MDQESKKLFAEFPPVGTTEWESRIQEDLKGADYAKKLIWKTREGFEVKPYYREDDLTAIGLPDSLPGTYPYIRGTNKALNTWDILQEIGTGDPRDANIFALDALRLGATGIGFWASGIKTVKHLEIMLKGICFGDCNIHFEGSANYPDLINLIAEFSRKHHINRNAMHGSLNFDPISYLLLEGDFWKSEEEDMGQVIDMVNLGKENLPNFRVINVNGQHFHNSGSTLTQEVAFSLASGNEYLTAVTSAGLPVDDVAKRLRFSFATGSNYFMEIARLRAARMLWARIVEQYNPQDEASMQMNIHCSTSKYNKSLYDPYVNILRSATEAMSAIIGGTQSLSITPFDAFYKDPDELSQRIARNQQIILKEESYLEQVVDPAAGSYYIESLTDSMARASWEVFRKVEALGGMLAAIKTGFIQDEISREAQQNRQDIANRRIIALGTNQYPNLEEMMLEKIQEEKEDDSLSIEEKPSTYPKLEICRITDEFDDLRIATEIYSDEGNKRPEVFLFTIGNLAMRKARAMFCTNFFGCAGYLVRDNPGFTSVAEGVEAVKTCQPEIVVICSSDEEYPELVPAIADEVRKLNKNVQLILAGYPRELIEDLKKSGIDDFIHIRTNVLEFLREMNIKLGITEK